MCITFLGILCYLLGRDYCNYDDNCRNYYDNCRDCDDNCSVLFWRLVNATILVRVIIGSIYWLMFYRKIVVNMSEIIGCFWRFWRFLAFFLEDFKENQGDNLICE
jgi:hypothetical protein